MSIQAYLHTSGVINDFFIFSTSFQTKKNLVATISGHEFSLEGSFFFLNLPKCKAVLVNFCPNFTGWHWNGLNRCFKTTCCLLELCAASFWETLRSLGGFPLYMASNFRHLGGYEDGTGTFCC